MSWRYIEATVPPSVCSKSTYGDFSQEGPMCVVDLCRFMHLHYGRVRPLPARPAGAIGSWRSADQKVEEQGLDAPMGHFVPALSGRSSPSPFQLVNTTF